MNDTDCLYKERDLPDDAAEAYHALSKPRMVLKATVVIDKYNEFFASQGLDIQLAREVALQRYNTRRRPKKKS